MCVYFAVLFVVFFFSSRRRHTRLQGDWSSDVCSSDLIGLDWGFGEDIVIVRLHNYPSDSLTNPEYDYEKDRKSVV